jgi:phosphoglycerate dehydrogenase-like enzyme
MSSQRLRVVTAGDLPASFPRNGFEDRVEFETAHTDEELRTGARRADVLYSWQIPDIVPAETPELRWIQLPSAGADHILNLPVWKSNVTITSSKGLHTVPMSEHLFALVLGLTRNIPAIVRAQDRQEWIHNSRASGLRFTELRGKTMGIVGWGKIGDGIAHLARGFGMRVVGTRWSVVVPRGDDRGGIEAYADPPWLEPITMPPDIVYPAAQMHEVLAASDMVVLLLPLTAETRGSFGTGEFKAMKRGALFFNLGRGAVVDEEALIAALRSGQLAGAGLDVFEQEPLPRSSPLWKMHNVIVSPHVGGVSAHTRERAAQFFAVNLSRYLEGEQLLNMVDKKQEY